MELKPDWQFILTAITAVSSAIAAIAASWSARSAQATAREATQARIAETRPLVLLTTRREGDVVVLVIRNFGGPAAAVSLKFLDLIPSSRGEDPTDSPIFTQPIPVLTPGEELTLPIAYWPDYWFTFGSDAAGARIANGWSGNPVYFRFDLRYRDPFTGTSYDEVGQVSIHHLAPTLADGPLRPTSDTSD
jgi:hypothetical protein